MPSPFLRKVGLKPYLTEKSERLLIVVKSITPKLLRWHKRDYLYAATLSAKLPHTNLEGAD
jgi:hypothetical protein